MTSTRCLQVIGTRIEWAPLCVPFPRRLQTLAAAAWFTAFTFGVVFGVFLTGYLLLFTRYWWLMLLYVTWIYLDRKTCEQGGRTIKWVQHWTWWRYVRDYFPLRLNVVPEAKFDPKKNYFFCCCPHGVLPTGAFNAFSTDSKKYRQLFPHHQPKIATLPLLFHTPFNRELWFSIGGISCSAKSINYILNKPEGGYFVCLVPGGAAESYYSRPGVYKTILKNRKGFIKLALKTQTPLVPVISFGETDLFDQFEGPKLKQIQEFFRRYLSFAPLLLKGRGFFQYSFGLIPRRAEVTVLVGKPLEFDRVEDPTKEQVDELHERYVTQLKSMFEANKHQYLKNPQHTFLEIV